VASHGEPNGVIQGATSEYGRKYGGSTGVPGAAADYHSGSARGSTHTTAPASDTGARRSRTQSEPLAQVVLSSANAIGPLACAARGTYPHLPYDPLRTMSQGSGALARSQSSSRNAGP